MMTGTGPHGPIGMGGMFTMLKVREDQKPDDYSDPGWYKHPMGTQAYEYQGNLPAVNRNGGGQPGSRQAGTVPAPTLDDRHPQARKPSHSTSGSHKH